MHGQDASASLQQRLIEVISVPLLPSPEPRGSQSTSVTRVCRPTPEVRMEQGPQGVTHVYGGGLAKGWVKEGPTWLKGPNHFKRSHGKPRSTRDWGQRV